jgi:hypothetical protein
MLLHHPMQVLGCGFLTLALALLRPVSGAPSGPDPSTPRGPTSADLRSLTPEQWDLLEEQCTRPTFLPGVGHGGSLRDLLPDLLEEAEARLQRPAAVGRLRKRMGWLDDVAAPFKATVEVLCGDSAGASRTMDEFTQHFPVVAQVRSAVEAFGGNAEQARHTQEHFLQHHVDSAREFAEAVPGLGHGMGAIMHATGDHEGGNRALIAASHTTGVMMGGMAVGGPGGAVAGGIAGGQAVDLMATGIHSLADGRFQPHGGLITTIGRAVNHQEVKPGDIFDATAGVLVDGVAGWDTPRMIDSFHGANSHILGRLTRERQKAAILAHLPDELPQATRHHVVHSIADARSAMEELNPRKAQHVATVVTDREGASASGFSHDARHEGRRQQYARGEIKQHEVSIDPLTAEQSTSRLLQREPHVHPVPEPGTRIRHPANCAEHDAVTNF